MIFQKRSLEFRTVNFAVPSAKAFEFYTAAIKCRSTGKYLLSMRLDKRRKKIRKVEDLQEFQ